MVKSFLISNNHDDIALINTVIESNLDITMIGHAPNFAKGLNSIFKQVPEILFVDLDLSEDIATFLLDVHQHLQMLPTLIAISKTKQKAYEAFKYGFFDFLAKPLTELAVRKSLMRYLKTFPIKNELTKICLKSYKDYQYLNTNDILFLKADNNTTDFYMKDHTTICSCKTLKKFEKALPSHFLRIHKSYIINSKYISRINYGKSMCIIDQHRIPFSKTFADNIYLINDVLSKQVLTLN